MKRLPTILLFIAFSIQLVAQESIQSVYVAGETINIKHEGDPATHHLQITHAFGTTIVYGEEKKGQTQYALPSIITNKSGKLNVVILNREKEVWSQLISIKADTVNEKTMESYCGPKHLIVSKNDFALVTSSVLDQYDNPLPEGTSINVNYLVNNVIQKKTIQTQPLLGFERVYAPKQRGFGAVSTKYENVGSKEFRLDFYPNDPENYRISYQKQHAYADGNQLINITTSGIKDRFGNQMDDGTLVYFSIIDSQNRVSSGTSETINGIAEFQIPAPENATIWKAKSYIPNYAEAREITISFKESVSDFTVEKRENEIQAGPIKGFMGQFVREGTVVTFILSNSEQMIMKEVPTKEGVALLNYEKKMIPSGTYQVEVKLGSIIKEINIEVK